MHLTHEYGVSCSLVSRPHEEKNWRAIKNWTVGRPGNEAIPLHCLTWSCTAKKRHQQLQKKKMVGLLGVASTKSHNLRSCLATAST